MGKINLFYKYVYLDNPQSYADWQRSLCEELKLKGRILLAHEGINATLGGSDEAIEQYQTTMLGHPLFENIDFKQHAGDPDFFPRLQVTVKKEIVKLGLDPLIISAEQRGQYLTPEQAHNLIEQQPDNLVILDTRNNYESRIGSFKGAIKPPLQNFRDLPAYLDEHQELFKDKQVLMYCTGGIRCERASAYLKSLEVAKAVYHIQGGIHRYVEQYPDGHFRGKNYVFDGRIAVPVTDEVLASCDACQTPYDEYSNCINAECNKHIIVCLACVQISTNTCSTACHDLVTSGKVNIRTMPAKVNLPNHAASLPQVTKVT